MITVDDDTLRAWYREMPRERDPGRAYCPQPETLVELLERRGSEAGRLATLNHVMSCEYCHPELELLRTVAEASRSPHRGVKRILALAAVLAVTAGGVSLWLQDRPEDVFRGAPDRIEIAAPPDGVAATGEMVLDWQPVDGALVYRVQVLDAAGELVLDSSLAETAIEFRPGDTGGDPPFTWWVEADQPDGAIIRSELRRILRVSP